MVDNINKLNTKNWSHKLNSIGEVVMDAEDIEQCYEVIFSTRIGTVPFNPNFGWDILAYHGQPITQVGGKMRTALLTALNKQEPRAAAQSVVFDYGGADNGQLIAEVEYVIKSTGETRRRALSYDTIS